LVRHRALGVLVVEGIPNKIALAARRWAHGFNVNVRRCDVGLAGRMYVVIVGQLHCCPGVEGEGGWVCDNIGTEFLGAIPLLTLNPLNTKSLNNIPLKSPCGS
jgi:hypothetical protein